MGRRTEQVIGRGRCVTRTSDEGLSKWCTDSDRRSALHIGSGGLSAFTRPREEAESEALPSRARCVSALYAVAIGVWDKLWKRLGRTSLSGLGLMNRRKTRANYRSRNSPGADTLVRFGLEIQKKLQFAFERGGGALTREDQTIMLLR